MSKFKVTLKNAYKAGGEYKKAGEEIEVDKKEGERLLKMGVAFAKPTGKVAGPTEPPADVLFDQAPADDQAGDKGKGGKSKKGKGKK